MNRRQKKKFAKKNNFADWYDVVRYKRNPLLYIFSEKFCSKECQNYLMDPGQFDGDVLVADKK